MPLPNFFVIGAAKSGTTALFHCLKQHPDIFMSAVKEPGYFLFGGNTPPTLPGPFGDRNLRKFVWRSGDYFRLFSDVGHQQAIGEATPSYLRTPEAARHIRNNIPHARLVVLLRHPAERAFSHYLFMAQQGAEPARSFAEALADERRRIEQGWNSSLYHRANGLYGRQLRVWYDLFPRDQIRVSLYEDWNEAPQALLHGLFGFLGVAQEFQPTVRRSNVTQAPRSRRLHLLALQLERLGGKRGRLAALASRLDHHANLAAPPPLDPALRRRLTDEYRPDILALQDLIGRDLSHWL